MTTSTTTRTAWLNRNEMRAWRAFAETNGHLMAALEADLVPHGLSMGDYEVLVRLSEADEQRLRMCDLAELLGLSPSGLTRRLDGLVKSGHVVREQSKGDRRVSLAVLTPAGAVAMHAAAGDHLTSVRRHLIDRLTPEQIRVLGDIFVSVADGLGREPTMASEHRAAIE